MAKLELLYYRAIAYSCCYILLVARGLMMMVYMMMVTGAALCISGSVCQADWLTGARGWACGILCILEGPTPSIVMK